MRIGWSLFLLFTVLAVSPSQAQQEKPIDTESVVTQVSDSPQKTDVADSVSTDTLTAAERAAKSFEERMKKAREQAPKKILKPRLSINDSLQDAFLPRRMDQRDWLTRSYYMNASDYFKFSPGYFVQRWQLTPGRSTVQPYGLTGDRLSYLHDGVAQHPFEHAMEPDGSMNIEDLSTSVDDGVFVMPGASGMIFGGEQAIATLVTTPLKPDPKKVESSFLVDKGNYGFSHTRGKYAHQFANGREVRMGIGYRVADGARIFGGNIRNKEDAYFYDGSVLFPIGERKSVEVTGHLYHRKGPQFIRPDSVASWVDRDRFDRNFKVQYSSSNDSQTVRTDLGYHHLRQGSYLTSAYRTRFNYTGHGLDFSRQWYGENHLIQFTTTVDRLEYDNTLHEYARHTTDMSLMWAKPHQTNRIAARFGAKYVEEFRVMPYGALLLLRESERFLLQASVGYAERAPSQHELYLPYKESQLYGIGAMLYADQGNRFLEIERQATGSLHLELGKAENAFIVEVVGGSIYNGIEWDRSLISVTTNAAWYFTPVNTDLSFATASAQKKFQFGETLSLCGGGSYFWREYQKYGKRPYQPDYQLFSGAELHHYWRSKLIHFWAYGEVQYVGEYDGYDKEPLGNQVVINGKLSFSMGNFRFKVVSQNLLDSDYHVREGFEIRGRVVTWGLDWNFFD
jgi:hypothetical protein